MSRSEKRTDWLGNEYILHLDDSGYEIGRSKTEEKFFGGKVTENYASDGTLQSKTEIEESLFGEERHVTRSTSGEIETVSTHESSLLGEGHYVNRGRDGIVVSRTYERKNWLGEGYRETIPSSGGDGIGGIVGLVLGIATLVLMLFVALSLLLTIPIWMGAGAVAGIIAYFHAPSVAAQIAAKSLPHPSVIARKRGRPPYFRFPREALKPALGFWSVLCIPAGAGFGFAAVMAFVMGAANQRDQISTLIFAGATVLAVIVAYRWSKRIYGWRLNQILLESRQIDTGKAGSTANVWNVLSICFVGLLTVGIIGSVVMTVAPSRFSRFLTLSMPPVRAPSNEVLDDQLTASSRDITTIESPDASAPAQVEHTVPSIPSSKASQDTAVSQFDDSSPAGDNAVADFPGERFPQTRLIALAESDVSSWPAADVQYAINEIFARHGAEFPNKQVSASFAQFAWYHPQPGVSFDQIEAALPTVERSNVQALGSVRNKKRASETNFVQQTVPQETVQMTQPLQNAQPDYPTAQWSLFNGCVFSPYPPNNLIRVDNVVPGSLVTDPTTNGVFRTPLQPPDPQSFPIAQWSNIPGNVISPYPPNNLLNVANIPPGTLRVDLTTNGVFRTPYEPGPSVDPTQIVGGLLNGISQAIQSNSHRRKRP